MRIFHTVSGLRDALTVHRREGLRIGFIPTMGNLHQGHLVLVEQARQSCDIVVCSIFVNALQFGLNEDWDKYPRTYQMDCDKLTAAGCDYLFHPDDTEMYPNGLDTQSRVICPTMTDVLCGASRPGHFEGVTTVVSKLFNIVQPDEAIFGIKDYQQLAVIRRMAEDLCMPVEITAAPIHREADGLAMSSRNSYITEEERPKVVILKDSLEWIALQVQGGARNFRELEIMAIQRIAEVGFKVDYITLSNSKTLDPAAEDDLEITILGAIFTESARLIDNLSIRLD
ncbi:pantoate--beta-alanine ligase [Porticoccaceae bacterium]|jgi:pantoate--beta-alanine ligase|nr:pantoate--beta-alanine ligase [Porticoccaceae bacterium]